jgi:uncharacterized protein YecE (DUF72 family)
MDPSRTPKGFLLGADPVRSDPPRGMRVLVGTSGYSYKEWKGTFYPEDLSDAEMLGFYAERFPTVEINNTFYRMPSRATLERWSSVVGDSFTFVLKAPRRITHEKRLNDLDALAYFFKTAAVLGDKLGPTLFQLPPFFKRDVGRLKDFLAALPPKSRAAFEFRHESWRDDEVLEALRARGAALCAADTDESPTSPLVATAPWGYLRLRRAEYSAGDLESWAQRIKAEPWEEAYVFFKHEDEGKGPELAARLKALL